MWTEILRDRFAPAAWAQGVADSLMGRIIAINTVGGRITVVTNYDRKYIVTIDLRDEDDPEVTCTCHRTACAHAAAACARVVLLEKQMSGGHGQKQRPQPKAQPQPAEKQPLLPPPPAVSRSTDYKHITGLYSARTVCSELRVSAAQKKAALEAAAGVRITSLYQTDAYGEEVLVARLACRAPGERDEVNVRVALGEMDLSSIECSKDGFIYSFQDRNKPCVHMLASLMILDAYLMKNPVGDRTSPSALQLLGLLQSGSIAQADPVEGAEGQVLSLEPVLDWEEAAPSLSFRMGSKRRYVVRNLQALTEAVDSGTALELGKEGRFDFSRDRFSEESAPWMDMIRTGVTETVQARDSLQQRTRWEIPKALVNSLELYGGRLDTFFDRFAPGSEIPGPSKQTYLYQTGRPPIRLTCEAVSDRSGELIGLRLRGRIGRWKKGGSRMYCRLDSAITGVPIENCRLLTALTGTAYNEAIDLIFGLQRMNEFLRHFLPRLENECEVERKGLEKLDAFIVPDAALTFYLDADGTSLTCRGEVAYGEDRAPLDNDCSGFPFADSVAERRALNAIRESFPEYDEQARVHRAKNDEDTLYSLLTGGADRLRELGEVLSSERFSRMKVRRKWRLNVGVRLEGGLMNLALSSDQLDEEELRDLLSHYTPKKKFHRLRNGDLVSLEENGESLQTLLEAMHLSPAELRKGMFRVPAYRALYMDKVLEEASGVYAQRDRAFRKLIASFKTVSDSDLEVPASLENVLRPYQTTGYRWLMTLALSGFGGILADDMGLGKTVQVIAMLLARRESGAAHGPSLVICPASLVYNWQAELQKFAPQLRGVPVAGAAAQRRALLSGGEADVFITSYGTALRDAGEYADMRFDCLILDEAQAIKTHTAAQSKAVRLIPAEHRFALTGTPIENNLSELWSIFDCLMPGFLYEYAVFRRELESPMVKEKDEKASLRLKRMVQPFILRRLKGDVLKELPPKLEESRVIELESEQRRLYDAHAQNLRRQLSSEDDESYSRSKIQVLAELTRLRQLCCDPALVYGEYKALSAKREALRDMLASLRAGGHKTLVFSQFPSLFELIRKDLQEDGVSFMTLTGDTPKQARLTMVDRFNRDDTPVFLISLKAGGTGLNLTGADTVIHLDPWWNLAAQNQATDRAHRIGQDKVVTVFRLIARDTIEERIVAMQEQKQDLADAILSGDMGGFAAMTREELMELIGS